MTNPDNVTNHPDTYIGFMRMSRPESHKTIVESYALSKLKNHFYVWDGVPKHHHTAQRTKVLHLPSHQRYLKNKKRSQTNETLREETEPLDRLSTLMKTRQKLDSEIRS